MTNGWTDDRVSLLKNLWTEGLSASQIAKQLGGVTRNAVIGKVHRLGLAGRAAPSRPVKCLNTPIVRLRPVFVAPSSGSGSGRGQAAIVTEDVSVAEAKAPQVPAQAIAKDQVSPAASAVVPPTPKPAKAKVRAVRQDEIIGVLDLGPNMCKWPIGDPGDADFGFCGSQCNSGAVYCTEHAAIAFQPAMARRPSGGRDDRAATEARRLARLAHM